MNYHNVYQATDETFFVLVCTRAGRYVDKGYATLEEAAWQADRAKWVLNNHGLIGRLSSYNFPDRLNAESESAWSVLPRPLVDFYCKHLTNDIRVDEDSAARTEELKTVFEKQRLADEESKKLGDDKRTAARETLTAIIAGLKSYSEQFDALNLPKNTKERNALHNAIGMMGARLAQLS